MGRQFQQTQVQSAHFRMVTREEYHTYKIASLNQNMANRQTYILLGGSLHNNDEGKALASEKVFEYGH